MKRIDSRSLVEAMKRIEASVDALAKSMLKATRPLARFGELHRQELARQAAARECRMRPVRARAIEVRRNTERARREGGW